MAVVFGWDPPEFVIPLPRVGDYLFALRAPTSWPVGTGIEFRFYRTPDPLDDPAPVVWPATVTGDTAGWHITAAGLTSLRAAHAPHVLLIYTDGAGTPLEWMTGTTRAV